MCKGGGGTGAALIALLVAGYVEASPPTPTEAVRETVSEVIRILSDDQLKLESQKPRRRRLLEETIGRRFDYEEMAKRSLAAQWVALSRAQREEFVGLFKSFLTEQYANRIEGYSGEEVQYLKERIEGRRAEVQTLIVSTKTRLPLDYRLLSKADDWYVYDVVIDGISLVRNYRAQFQRIIRDDSYGGLVDRLRAKAKGIISP